MELYFIRHGQTDFNISFDSGEAPTSPIWGEPLNTTGKEQAEKLADELKGIKFEAIISSPLLRAKQTAEIINQYHGLPISYRDEWQERKSNQDIDYTTWVKASDFDDILVIDGLEGLDEFYDRIENAYGELISEFAGKKIALVSHGGVSHVVYGVFNQLPRKGNIRKSPMENCEYRIYDHAN